MTDQELLSWASNANSSGAAQPTAGAGQSQQGNQTYSGGSMTDDQLLAWSNGVLNYGKSSSSSASAEKVSDRGRGRASHLRQSMAEGSYTQDLATTPEELAYYNAASQGYNLDTWYSKAEAESNAASERYNQLKAQLDDLNAKESAQDNGSLFGSAMAKARGEETVSDDEVSNLQKAVEQAKAESDKKSEEFRYAKQYKDYRDTTRAVEDAYERGLSYSDINKSYSQSLEELNKARAAAVEDLNRIRNGAGYYGAASTYEEDKARQEADEKDALARLENLERQIERVGGLQRYATSRITSERGAEAVIRQGEELARTAKEQYLAGNIPDPTSNADYRTWVENNPGKTARDYAEQQYADREPNDLWTQEEKNRYFILMTDSPERAFQYAVEINSAINSEVSTAAAERFANLFPNYDMSEEARAGRSGITNALMRAGNAVSDVAGIAGGVATGPVKLFNWLDNIYQNNERGGYYAGNNTPRISDYTDRLLNQNTERLNSYGTISNDVPVLGGKGLGDLYQLVESVAQSMTYGAGLSKAFGVGATTAAGLKAAQQAAKLSTGMIFFGQAADSSYNEYVQRGMSREQAAVGSFFAGLAEAMGEELSIDHLISGDIADGLAKYVAKQSFIEASEEGFTNVLNLFGDELAARMTGGESKMRQDIEALKRSGMSEEDAKRQVWKEFVDSTVFDMLGGAISGGLSSGAYVAPNALYNYVQNRNNRNQQNQQTAQPAQTTQTEAAETTTSEVATPTAEAATQPQAAEATEVAQETAAEPEPAATAEPENRFQATPEAIARAQNLPDDVRESLLAEFAAAQQDLQNNPELANDADFLRRLNDIFTRANQAINEANATASAESAPTAEPAPAPETASAESSQATTATPTESTTADSTSGSGPERERGFSANVATDQAMDKPLQESFQDNPDTYRQLTNKETLKRAQDIFNENKEDARNYVVSALAEARSGRKLDPVIVPLARMVANDMSRNGNVDGARSILSDLAVELTAAGQLGQAAKILREADPNTALKAIQKALDRINKEAAQKGFSWRAELTAEEKSLIDSTDFTQDGAYEKVYKQISKRVGGEMPATVWEKLNEIRRINMLLRPRTIIKNFASNVPMVGVRKLSEAVSARIQGALVKSGKLDAADRTRAVASQESKQIANDYFAANKDDILGEGNKWDLNSMLRGDRTIFKDKLLKNTALGQAVSKMTDKEIESFGEALRQVTYNLLERGDAPFVKSAFVDSLAQFCEARGITDASGITQEAIDFATANAYEATFKAANTVAKAINQLKRDSSPAVSAAIDVILPFTTTPANIMNLMGQYSPVGFANMLGNKSIADKVDAFSKAATGSALMAIGFMLRQAGFITGGEDDDKDKAALDRATGNAAYSIGGRVSYDWIQPVGSLFALGAEISDAIAGHEGVGDAIMNAIYTTGDSVLNMSMFQNILSVLKGKGSSTEKIVDAIMEGGLTQLMPGLAGDIAKIIDGTVRSTYTGGNAFQSSIAKAQAATPGASMLLPPSMNVKGEENTRGNLLWRVISQTLFPFNVNIGTKNDVDNEIYRLYDETGSNTHFPNVSPYKVDSDGQTYKMNGDERAKYQETQGQTYYELAKQAIESKAYKAMTAEQQQLVLHNIATYANSEAKAEFLNAKGQKADSNLSKLYSGVGSPGDSDYVPALDPKNAGEYIAFDAAYKKAVNTGNYAALDSLLSDYGKMSGNAQEVLTANNPGQNDGFGVKRLLEMRDLGISAADYSGIRQAQKDAKEQYGLSSTTGSTAKLFAIATAPLSDSQKQKLLESEAYGISKTVKSLYGILSQYGYDYQDTAEWMYNVDYDHKGESDGVLTQVEVIRGLERTKDIPNKEAVYQQMKEAFRNEHKINSYYEGSYQSELDYYNRNGWKAGREPTGNLLYDYTR